MDTDATKQCDHQKLKEMPYLAWVEEDSSSSSDAAAEIGSSSDKGEIHVSQLKILFGSIFVLIDLFS